MTDLPHPDEEVILSAQPPQQRTIRIAYGTEALQFGELHLPQGLGPHSVVILIHGGFWRSPYDYTLMTGLAEDLVNRGIAAWNIEYRRIGDPGGGWPNTLLDVAKAADYLPTLASTYNLDLTRVVPVGHSAGGHLALWLAGRPRIPRDSILAGFGHWANILPSNPLPIIGVVSLAGVSDLELGWKLHLGNDAVTELLDADFPDAPMRYQAASPAALLPLGIPQILIHGTADDRVPFNMSRIYAAKALSVGDEATLVEFPGTDHFALIDPHSHEWATTVDSIKKLPYPEKL